MTIFVDTLYEPSPFIITLVLMIGLIGIIFIRKGVLYIWKKLYSRMDFRRQPKN